MRVARTEQWLKPAAGRRVLATVLTGFGRPFGLAMDASGRLYVADMDLHSVLRLSGDLDEFSIIGFATEANEGFAIKEGISPRSEVRAPGLLNGPHSVAIAADSSLYVTTYYRPSVQVFSPEGEPVFAFGNNRAEFCLAGPSTGFFDASERFLVSEYKLNAILAFDRDGHYLGGLGANDCQLAGFSKRDGFAASSAPRGFDRPHMCRQGPDGTIVVTDTWNHRLQRFTTSGQWLGWLGAGKDGAGNGWRQDAVRSQACDVSGGLNAPVAVTWSASGGLLVTEWGNNRLQQFDASGRPTFMIDGLDLERPYDAQFFGSDLYVADSHHGRVLRLDANSLL